VSAERGALILGALPAVRGVGSFEAASMHIDTVKGSDSLNLVKPDAPIEPARAARAEFCDREAGFGRIIQ